MASENPGRMNLLPAFIVLTTFLLGGVTGAGVHASLSRREGPPPLWGPPPHGPPHGPPPGAPPGEKRLPPPFEALGLSAEQREKAQAIFEKHRPKLEAVFQETLPRVRALQEEMDRELETVLTPPQQRRLEELKAQRPPAPLGGPPPFDGPPPHRGPPPPFGGPPPQPGPPR